MISVLISDCDCMCGPPHILGTIFSQMQFGLATLRFGPFSHWKLLMKYALTVAICSLVSHAAIQAADVPPAKLMIGSLPAAKVLFLGNSITLHGPAPGIGWNGNWGMAASVKEKDYVHLLTADIAKAAGSQPETMVRNIASFERGYDIFDIEKEFKEELSFNADVVIVAIGENVSEPVTDEARANFAAAFARLLAALKQHGPPAIFVRSSFWPNETKDGLMRKASADAGITFVDIAKLGRDKENAASAERKIEHAGVAAHPGDKGMGAIADEIFIAIRRKAGTAAKP